MTDGETPARDSDARLEDWRELMHPRLARLQDFELPDDFPFDYSRDSLNQLEVIVLERFEVGSWSTPDARSFVEGAMGYLGEALLRIGGGSWAWDDDAESSSYDFPLVRPDGELGVPQVSPLDLIAVAARTRSGGEFARVHKALQTAVADRQAVEPSWNPTKELTPGVDDILDRAPSEFLDRWLAEREAGFPRWLADYAGGHGTWDFSPESLDTLQALVCSNITSVDDFYKPEFRDLTDGAAWYFGQVMKRVADAQWCYNPGEPDPYDPWVGEPYIKQTIQDGHANVPILGIEEAVHNREPGFLRGRLKRFK